MKARITYVLIQEVDVSLNWFPPDFQEADIVTALRAAHWEEARQELADGSERMLSSVQVTLKGAS